MKPADHAGAAAPVTEESGARVRFEELYWANARFVTRYVASQVRRGDGHLIDDLVQETFISAWRGLPGARFASPGSAQAWLRVIARRTVSTYYRSRPGRVIAHESPTDPTAAASVLGLRAFASADDVDRVCLLVDIAASMAAATAEERRAVELRVVAGQTWRAAGLSMGRCTPVMRRLVGEALGAGGAELGAGAVRR